jgi:hypothetical protein
MMGIAADLTGAFSAGLILVAVIMLVMLYPALRIRT